MKLLSPIRIGDMQLKNRIVMSPMTTNYGNEDQTPSQRLIDFLVERAKGGVGLITVEVCTVDVKQKYQPQSLTLGGDEFIAAHKNLTDALHQYGVKVQPQITHPGPESMCSMYSGEQAVGPSVCLGASTGWPSRALAIAELDDIVELYAQAARRAREAGYDGMELHAAHGYMLLGTFLSPWKNKREDEYGAQTIENRTRLLLRVIRRIKEVAGKDFPITLRCSGFERVAGGRDSYDMARIAPLLVEAGIDAFHVSGGVSDVLVSQIVCGNEFPNGYNVPEAEAIKRMVDVPVMVVGRIHDPEYAEEILQQERADMIVLARPLLVDPQLPNKVAAGKLDEIRRCISCQNCIDSMLLWPMENGLRLERCQWSRSRVAIQTSRAEKACCRYWRRTGRHGSGACCRRTWPPRYADRAAQAPGRFVDAGVDSTQRQRAFSHISDAAHARIAYRYPPWHTSGYCVAEVTWRR